MRNLTRPGLLAVGALVAAFTTPTLGHAQAEAHAMHASGPVIDVLMRDIATLEEKLLGLADAIPEESWDWRPGEAVRSVSEVVMHVAADNYFMPTIAGVAAPAATGIQSGDYPSVQAYEGRTVSKAEAMQAMRDSFAHLRTAMEGVDEASLGESMEVFGSTMTGLDLWVITTTHLHEHLGQAIAYARSNGVVPPWSRG